MVKIKKRKTATKPGHLLLPSGSRDAVVVGGGIVGKTITKALRKQKMTVCNIDAQLDDSGTKPSGGHLKPSWFNMLKAAEYEPALTLLDECWGLHTDDFRLWPLGKTTKVYRVDTDQVLADLDFVTGTVTGVLPVAPYYYEVYGNRGSQKFTITTPLVVMALGVRQSTFDPNCVVQRKSGISFRYSGVLDEPFIRPWAPYKQIVAHQQGPEEIWVGDGSAIIPKNWTEEREQQCLDRCRKQMAKGSTLLRRIRGVRAFCKALDPKHPCYFHNPTPGLYHVTGAGKNGTIAAGWAAKRIIDAHC